MLGRPGRAGHPGLGSPQGLGGGQDIVNGGQVFSGFLPPRGSRSGEGSFFEYGQRKTEREPSLSDDGPNW